MFEEKSSKVAALAAAKQRSKLKREAKQELGERDLDLVRGGFSDVIKPPAPPAPPGIPIPYPNTATKE